MEKFLVISEVSKKQNYIFKTNKLKENIGASVIIEYVTEKLPREQLKKVLGVDDISSYEINAGGGNCIFMVDTEAQAKAFIKATTSYVLKEFPGIEFFMAYEKFEEGSSIIKAIDAIYKKLNRKKSARASVFARKSYGIEQECVTTHMPAYNIKRIGSGDCSNCIIASLPVYKKNNIAKDNCNRCISKCMPEYNSADGSVFLSREALVKRGWSNEYLEPEKELAEKGYVSIGQIIKKYEKEGFIFTNVLDDLITQKGDNSYVAIVTLDGNKMGQKIQKLRDRFDKDNPSAVDNEGYIKALQSFSKQIKIAYGNAFEKMLEAIAKNYGELKKKEVLNLKDNIMPIRPIILAGDDVCFVCNAKIALECVRIFMEELNKADAIEGEKLNACAGICMQKSTYPFDKGYEIAENLCKNGKAKIVDSNDASLVDFHICQGEISTSLGEIRKRVFINDKEIELNVKPLYISITEPGKDDLKKGIIRRELKKAETYNTYENFIEAIDILEAKQKEYGKGKIRKLRDVFPQGLEKTKLFMNKNRMQIDKGFKLKDVNFGFSKLNKKSNGKDTCLYFDIIELNDLFIKLDNTKGE